MKDPGSASPLDVRRHSEAGASDDQDQALLNQINRLNYQFYIQSSGKEYTHLSPQGPVQYFQQGSARNPKQSNLRPNKKINLQQYGDLSVENLKRSPKAAQDLASKPTSFLLVDRGENYSSVSQQITPKYSTNPAHHVKPLIDGDKLTVPRVESTILPKIAQTRLSRQFDQNSQPQFFELEDLHKQHQEARQHLEELRNRKQHISTLMKQGRPMEYSHILPAEKGQVFEGFHAPKELENSRSHVIKPTLPRLSEEQEAQHQQNIKMGKVPQSKMKAAIQKQIVDFAHKQSSINLSLQEVFEKRQLAGVQKAKQSPRTNILSLSQIDPSQVPPGLDLSKDEIIELNKQIQSKKIAFLEARQQANRLSSKTQESQKELSDHKKTKKLDYIQRLIDSNRMPHGKKGGNFFVSEDSYTEGSLHQVKMKGFIDSIERKGDNVSMVKIRAQSKSQNQHMALDSNRRQADFMSPQPRRKVMLEDMEARSQSSSNLNAEKNNLYLHKMNKMILKLKQQNQQELEQSPLKMPGLDGSVAIINYQSQSKIVSGLQKKRYSQNRSPGLDQNDRRKEWYQEASYFHRKKHSLQDPYSQDLGEELKALKLSAQSKRNIKNKYSTSPAEKRDTLSPKGRSPLPSAMKTLGEGISGSQLKLPNQLLEKEFIKLKQIQAYLSPNSSKQKQQQQSPYMMSYNTVEGGIQRFILAAPGQNLSNRFNTYLQQQAQLYMVEHNTSPQYKRDFSYYQPAAYFVPERFNVEASAQHMKNKMATLENEHRMKEKAEFKALFSKLGLDYENDVPKPIKAQLRLDKNAKRILEDLGREYQQTQEIENLDDYLNDHHGHSLPDNTLIDKIQKRPCGGPTADSESMQNTLSNLESADIGISILSPPNNRHVNHPINKYLRLVNEFCNLSLVRAANFRYGQSSQGKFQTFDMASINALARQLKIEIPKSVGQSELQNMFKSKQFVVGVKAIVLQKLFAIINRENDLKLNFERSNFQFYRGFIGRGNNGALVVQVFKLHRWWWSIYQSLQYDEEGNPILPYSAQHQQSNPSFNMQLYRESFQEHNFLWTQWKKPKHFQFLKPAPPPPPPPKEEPSPKKSKARRKKSKHKKKDESKEASHDDPDLPKSSRSTSKGRQEEAEAQQQLTGPNQNLSNTFKVYAKLENNFHLANKFALFYNMRRYYRAMGRDPFDVIPVTFHVKRGSEDPEFHNFLAFFQDIESKKVEAVEQSKEMLLKKEVLEREIVTLEEKLKELNKGMKFSLDESTDAAGKQAEQQEADTEGEEKASKHSRQEDEEEKEEPPRSKSQFLPEVKPQESQKELILDEQLLRKMQMKKRQILRDQERLTVEKRRATAQVACLKRDLDKVHKIKETKNIWIVKPGENTNRGVGISVQTKISEIKALVNAQSGNAQHTFILQKYIERPALYKGRKFDIRCFAIITSINGRLKGYVYDDCYLRTSGREYNLKNLNKVIHLTNDAVQKRSEDYGRFEFGNKVSLQEYSLYLAQAVPHLNVDFRQHIFSQMKRIMMDTIQACYKVIDPQKRHHSFEILGYDFMLDEDFKVYLIESNTNPSLETTCPLLHKFITDLVDTGLRIGLDPLFPPPNYTKRMSMQIPLTLWELVYDSKLDDQELDEAFSEYDRKQSDLARQQQVENLEQIIKQEVAAASESSKVEARETEPKET